MNLLISVRSEILKTRRTATFYFTIIAAAIVPVIYVLNIAMGDEMSNAPGEAFNHFMRQGAAVLSIAIFPMFVVLSTTMLPQIEFRNNTWKQVFASPQPIQNIFFARYLNIHLLILAFLLLYHIFMLIAAVAIHFMAPASQLLNSPLDLQALMTTNLNCYIAILSLSAIHFWLGLQFRNFIVPIAIGFAMWFAAMLMVMELKTPNAEFQPYTHLLFSTFPEFKDKVPKVQLISVGYMVLFLGLGYLSFKRKIK